MNLDPYLTPNIKINLKWIKDLNLKDKTIKLLKEKTGINFWDPALGNSFSGRTLKHKQQQNRYIGFHQNLKLCDSKNTIKKVKRQPIEWEKTSANHLSDK